MIYNKTLSQHPLLCKSWSNKSLVCCKTKSAQKITHFAKQDQKVTEEDEEDRETEGNWVLPEELAQKGHLVNMDL